MRSTRAWLAAAVLGLILSTLWVLQASGAKFTAATPNTGNSATAATIAAPAGVSATASAVACRINVTWTMSATTWASGYHVYRSGSSAGPYSHIGTSLGRSAQAYNDESSSLKIGITYYYQVRAYYGNWLSPWSNTASATGPALCGGGA